MAVLSSLGFVLAQHWAGRLTPAQFLLAMAVLEFAIQPLSYLIHELGHGLAACWLTHRPARIVVGRGPYLQFSLGQIRVSFSLLPNRGVMVRGICHYDGDGVAWRDRAVISLSGPAATLLELLAGVCLALVLWPHVGIFARDLIAFSLIGLLGSLLFNLLPVSMVHEGKRIAVANDGTKARVAMRLHRQRAPVPRVEAASQAPRANPTPTRTFAPELPGAARIAREDHARKSTSTPPPPRPAGR